MRMLTRDQNGCAMGLFVLWSDHRLFLHTKESEIASIVKRLRRDGSREVIIVPVRTKKTWFWSLGEVTVNWWDLSLDEPLFQDVHGGHHMQEPDTQYRAIAFHCLGDQQEGVNCTDWKRGPGYNLDSEGGFYEVIGTPKSKGTDRKRWRLKCHKLAILRKGQWIRQTLSCPRRVAP